MLHPHILYTEEFVGDLQHFITIPSSYTMVSSQKRVSAWTIMTTFSCFVEKFTIYNMSVPHKEGIPKSKENYAHEKLGPMECNQGDVGCYIRGWLWEAMKQWFSFKSIKL